MNVWNHRIATVISMVLGLQKILQAKLFSEVTEDLFFEKLFQKLQI